jgi:poly-gamma-glutamate system protein
MNRQGDPVVLGVLLGVLVLWYGALSLGSGGDPAALAEDLRASRTMARALGILKEEAALRGVPLDPVLDPDRTGLVGTAWSPLTTTLGSLAAKRTGLQPDAAALMARLLRQAGLQKGGRVAVDTSGSFPGFAIATLIAAETLGAETTCIVSLGASTYGANYPDFTLADMVAVLASRGLLRWGLTAVSPGGDDDLGRNMGGPELERALSRANVLVIREGNLARNLAARRTLLLAGRRPQVLVSVGGNLTSTGLDAGFGARVGLIWPADFRPGEVPGQGLVQTALREGIPIIRVLDVRDLCARSGLPFDPIPAPGPGQSGYFSRHQAPPALLIGGPVLAFLVSVLVGRARDKGRLAVRPGGS